MHSYYPPLQWTAANNSCISILQKKNDNNKKEKKEKIWSTQIAIQTQETAVPRLGLLSSIQITNSKIFCGVSVCIYV